MNKVMLLVMLFSVALFVRSVQAQDKPMNKENYSAELVRTTHGIAHIRADSLANLGFGSGYAQAEDHLCTLADNYLRIQGERARFFGAHRNEAGDNQHIIEDFGYKALALVDNAEALWSDLSPEARALIQGFAAGYNKYLATARKVKDKPHKSCIDEPWVRPIKQYDVLGYLFSIAVFPGAMNFLEDYYIASPDDESESLIRLTTHRDLPFNIGSNAWALGSEYTKGKSGMLLANPHFPYEGDLQFWQSHAIVANDFDTMGASLIGFPGVINIGFNKDIAWTHTFSSAEHFVIYRMSTGPDSLQTYEFDGQIMDVQKRLIEVVVKVDDGYQTLSRPMYFTHIGRIVENDMMPWDKSHFYVIKDANEYNIQMVDHWLALNRADSLQAVKDVFKQHNGLIFNNTLITGKEGKALFIGDAAVPALPAEALRLIAESEEIASVREDHNLTMLPGQYSHMVFDDYISYEQIPILSTRSYVQNANDSHWATNMDKPLEGFSPLLGKEKSELSFRTRMSLTLLKEERGEDQRFSMEELEATMFSTRSYLAELILPDLRSMCKNSVLLAKVQSLKAEYSTVLSPACQVIAAWNGRFDKSAKGSLLLRELAFMINSSEDFSVPFSAQDPLNTPRSFKATVESLAKLAHVAVNLSKAGISLDSSVADYQFFEASTPQGNSAGQKLFWPGLFEEEGGFNMIAAWTWDRTLQPRHYYGAVFDHESEEELESGLTESGYHIRFGSSWIMAVEYIQDKVIARGILTYSQSSDGSSDYAHQQSLLYSQNAGLHELPFTKKEIAKAQISRLSLGNSDTLANKTIH